MIQPEPFMIDIAEPSANPAERMVEILVGSFGLVGVIALGALLIGGLAGAVLLWLRSGDPFRRS